MKAFIVAVLLPTSLAAFSAIWNFPSETCHKNQNTRINFTDYKIKTNTDLSFYGEEVVILYEFSFGRYPYYKNYSKDEPINGGLPQTCSLEEHLKVAKENITKNIPNNDFGNLAIIDFEEWRPLFSQNGWKQKQVFQNESILRVQNRYKENSVVLDYKQARPIAEKEFNDAAREFFVKTIQMANETRPHAKWGFYGFPYCNYDAGQNNTLECKKSYRDQNDNMSFIYDESKALYPSIYLSATTKERFYYVQAVLKEARRVSKKYNPPLPIYAYTKIEYDPLKELKSFYSKSDLCATIEQAADLGIDGVILWSSSKNMTERCPFIKEEIEKAVGPYIEKVTSEFEKCAQEKCSGNGKCVRIGNSTCLDEGRMKNPQFPLDFTLDRSKYRCECNNNLETEDCRPKVPLFAPGDFYQSPDF